MSDDLYEETVVNLSHNDLDGMCSSQIVRMKYPHAKIFHCNYGRDVMNMSFIKGCKMIITDFTPKEMEFEKIKHLGINCSWIDHHKTNFEGMQNKGYNFPGLRRDDACGALLTWKFLFPSVPPPEVVLIVDDYDRWQFKYGDRTKWFSAGMGLFETRPALKNCHIWNDLFSPDAERAKRTLENVIAIGKKITEYNVRHNALLCQDLCYTAKWRDKRLLVANYKHANSLFFDSMDKSNVQGLSILQFAADVCKYRCSVYSPDDHLPILDIVQSYPGGGGHPCAGGFQSREFPFSLPEIKEPRPMESVIRGYQEINAMRRDVIIGQSGFRSDRISLMSQVFKSRFLDKQCLAINHPYVSELIRLFPATCDLINPATGSYYEMFVGFTLTNTGWWRMGIYHIDQANLPTMDEFRRIEQVAPEIGFKDFYIEDLGQMGKVFWFYMNQQGDPVYYPMREYNS